MRHGTTRHVFSAIGLLLLALAVATPAHAQQKPVVSFASSPTGTSQHVYVGMLIGTARLHLTNVSFSNEVVSGTGQTLDLLRRGETALEIASPERLFAAHHGIGSYKDRRDGVGGGCSLGGIPCVAPPESIVRAGASPHLRKDRPWA